MARHDEHHLRRFLEARARGDAQQMRRWWDELVVDFFDRIDALVYATHRGRLDDEEHELAVQLAMTRFSVRLIVTFDGVSMGQLVNACHALARGICIDVQRASVRRRAHGEQPLEAPEDVPRPRWEADEATRRFERETQAGETRDFLAWALPLVKGQRRRVLELTFRGADIDEIACELGITRANAYQRRSRGLKDLKRLKEQYDS